MTRVSGAGFRTLRTACRYGLVTAACAKWVGFAVDEALRAAYDFRMSTFQLPADELEYVVLAKLWELGTASVRDVYAQLDTPEPLVYTTIAKVIDRLRGKGLIQRNREGKAFVYRARIAPQEVERARAEDAVSRLLGPSPRSAVAALVDAVDAVDPRLLDELERAVTAHRRSKRGT
jgi:predicted transcriptional regulator